LLFIYFPVLRWHNLEVLEHIHEWMLPQIAY
jgi:3'-phosphoadenosine 5'-phosphosulfate sulfotransferase (PAPS reductase)/FAD synthetase